MKRQKLPQDDLPVAKYVQASRQPDYLGTRDSAQLSGCRLRLKVAQRSLLHLASQSRHMTASHFRCCRWSCTVVDSETQALGRKAT